MISTKKLHVLHYQNNGLQCFFINDTCSIQFWKIHLSVYLLFNREVYTSAFISSLTSLVAMHTYSAILGRVTPSDFDGVTLLKTALI